MQVYNIFLLMLTAVPILVAGIFARTVSKNRAIRTVAGMAAPMLILTVMCIFVEMVVAGYEESAGMLGAADVPYMLFPRHAFTGIIVGFFAISCLSVGALKMTDKIKPLVSFSVLSALTLIFAFAVGSISFLDKYSEHSLLIFPVCIIFAIGEIFALAATVLKGEKKLEKAILYLTNIIYLAVCAFLLWFAYSAGFTAEIEETGEITMGAIVFIVLGITVVAGPALISFFALLSDSISSFKYIKKDKK